MEHKDINDLIADRKRKEQQDKLNAELTRQKELFVNELLPFLRNFSTSITESKVTLNKSIEAVQKTFQDIVKEEQALKSGKTVEELGIPERIDRDPNNQRVASVIDKVKTEKVSTAISILSTLYALIAGAEAEENAKRNVKDLTIDV